MTDPECAEGYAEIEVQRLIGKIYEQGWTEAIEGHLSTFVKQHTRLIELIAEGINADLWVWGGGPIASKSVFPHDMFFGSRIGLTEKELIRATRGNFGPEALALGQAALSGNSFATALKYDLIPKLMSKELDAIRDLEDSFGLTDFILTIRVDDGHIWAAGFHRRGGLFTRRDKRIVNDICKNSSVAVARNRVSAEQLPKLTPRQSQILYLILRGHTYSKISFDLELSKHTVEDHAKKIRNLFGGKSRDEIQSLFIERGMLSASKGIVDNLLEETE